MGDLVRFIDKAVIRSKSHLLHLALVVIIVSALTPLIGGGTATADVASVDITQPTDVHPSFVAPGASVAINGTAVVSDGVGGSVDVEVTINGTTTYYADSTSIPSYVDLTWTSDASYDWQVIYPDHFDNSAGSGGTSAPALQDGDVGTIVANGSGGSSDTKNNAIMCSEAQVWVSPHKGGELGGFGTTPDGCAGCHRAHTAQGTSILSVGGNMTNFCYSCHESGTGAYTDVANGLYLGQESYQPIARIWEGYHSGPASQTTLIDPTANWNTDELVGFTVYNITDMNLNPIPYADVISNTTTVVTHSNLPTGRGWDDGDEYWIADPNTHRRVGRNYVADTDDSDGMVLTDLEKRYIWTLDEFVGFTVYNLTDGSSGIITTNSNGPLPPNWGQATCASLSGGQDNQWDVGDYYWITDNSSTNKGLRGGGFDMALMDTDLDSGPSMGMATSLHNTSETGTVWGSNNTIPDGGAGDMRTLECTNCHNPHGNSHYRILRPTPGITFGTGLPTTPTVEVPYEGGSYTITYDADGYRIIWSEEPGNYWNPRGYHKDTILELGKWCTTCHIMYEAEENSGTTDSLHSTFPYRHWTVGQPDIYYCENCHTDLFDPDLSTTEVHLAAHGIDRTFSNTGCGNDGPCHIDGTTPYPYGHETPYTCLGCHSDDAPAPAHLDSCFACHVAHGTTATMDTYSGTVPWPDGTTTPDGDGRSSLLWVDNRGTCTQCHGDHILEN
ncbi:MAG: cytochrome c3 family protein [Chloroflexota bacterium]|nr:cytochrome c3 family protein [Chloroflexota bacterium]